MKISKAVATVPSSSEVVGGELERFCEERGLDVTVAAQAGLYIETEGDYKNWLAIPYPNVGGSWGVRYRRLIRTGGPKYISQAGWQNHLYNPQLLGPQSREVWFCEAELDALILWQYGVPAIGAPGTPTYAMELFQQAWSLLYSRAKVVIATDSDEAGHQAANDISRAFQGRDLHRLEMPDGYDVNDWHLKEPDELRRAIHGIRQS